MQERPSTTWVIALSLLLVGAWAGCTREMRTAEERAELTRGHLYILRRHAGVDPDSVRNEELIALLEREARAFPDDLIKSGVKPSVVYLLAKRGAEEAIPAVRRYLKRLDTNRELHSRSDAKLAVCRALYKLGDDEEAWIPTCVSLLESERWFTRIRAAELLAWVGDARGWLVIESALTDPDRSRAVTAQEIRCRLVRRLQRPVWLPWVLPALGLVAAAALGAAGFWLVRRRRKSAEGG